MEAARTPALLLEHPKMLDLGANFVVESLLLHLVHGFLQLDRFAPAQLLNQSRFLVEEVIRVVVALDDQLVWGFDRFRDQLDDYLPEILKLVLVVRHSHVVKIILHVWKLVDQREFALMLDCYRR